MNIHRRLTHEASQPYIKDESTSLTNHLERIGADMFTKQSVDSLILALKDKNELATQLYEENDRLNRERDELGSLVDELYEEINNLKELAK